MQSRATGIADHILPLGDLFLLSFFLSFFLSFSLSIFPAFFLVADTQLYKRLCPSVHQSVHPLVRRPTRLQLVAVYPALFFLVVCYATQHPALSVRRSVRLSVRPSVRPSIRHTLLFFGFLRFLASLLLPN